LTARHYYNLCFRHNRAGHKMSGRQAARRSAATVARFPKPCASEPQTRAARAFA
jgi:hypothetical protein